MHFFSFFNCLSGYCSGSFIFNMVFVGWFNVEFIIRFITFFMAILQSFVHHGTRILRLVVDFLGKLFSAAFKIDISIFLHF